MQSLLMLNKSFHLINLINYNKIADAIGLQPCYKLADERKSNRNSFGFSENRTKLMATSFVSYLRVSTNRQEISGLGIEAQRASVLQYCESRGDIIAEYVETESGKVNDRIELRKAFSRCKQTNSILIIAKIDRLSRNAHFLLGLQESNINFVCVDMPDATPMLIGLMAVIAQHEREQISKRTIAALAALKARGVVLGRRKGLPSLLTDQTRALGRAKNKQNSIDHANELYPIIQTMVNGGLSFTLICRELNRGNYTTSRGISGKWTITQVQRILFKAFSE